MFVCCLCYSFCFYAAKNPLQPFHFLINYWIYNLQFTINKMMQLHHSRLLHYIILLYHAILGCFILYQHFIFKTAIIILFLFLFSIFYYLYFHLHLPKVKCSRVAFPFVSQICVVLLFPFSFFPREHLSRNCRVKINSFILFSSKLLYSKIYSTSCY